MSAHDFDDKSTSGLTLSILNRYITFFNSGVLLPYRVTHTALENGEQSLNFVNICSFKWISSNDRRTLLYILQLNLSLDAVLLEPLKWYFKKKLLPIKVKDAYADLDEFKAVKISWWQSIYRRVEGFIHSTLSWTASIDTASLNFPRQTKASWNLPKLSGPSVKLKIAISRSEPFPLS